jgi:hypothetical protein
MLLTYRLFLFEQWKIWYLSLAGHQHSTQWGGRLGIAAELLGFALAAEQLPGAAVILDIAKAYDTVDRSFLFHIIAAAGCGQPMVQWVQLLLSGTQHF